VWIHGGGNVDGESNDYDGSKLATGGPNGSPTVVVTMNYRMGLFGYLAHPALDNEGHSPVTMGSLDIQAVLRWVQRNIDTPLATRTRSRWAANLPARRTPVPT
jgi:para-nitrobenzyl esterase